MKPFTPAHLLCGRRITSLPHEHEEKADDPDYMDAPTTRRQIDNHSKIISHFQSRWKREYLTSLREFHKAFGHNKQLIKKGDVVLVHNDKPRLNWKLVVIEELLTGNDGLVRAANIRTGNHITSRPISKLYPLEVSSTVLDLPTEKDREECNKVPTTTEERPERKVVEKAKSLISQWTRDLCRLLQDVEN